MRFEMNSADVDSLVEILTIYIMGSSAEGLDKWFKEARLKNAARLVKKIKIYGLKAFANREEYRDNVKELMDMIESARKED